jgi:hypothetical protein
MRAITLLVLLVGATFADTVELKTGEKIEGTFKQATAAGAVIEVGGQSLTFTMDKVRAIYLGAAPPAMPATSLDTDALDALRSLQSVTSSGVSYRDYAPRVLDAKVKVDKLLSADTSAGPRRDHIRLSMRYYEFASTAWNSKISNSGRYAEVGAALRNDPAFSKCPGVQALFASGEDMIKRYPPQIRNPKSLSTI